MPSVWLMVCCTVVPLSSYVLFLCCVVMMCTPPYQLTNSAQDNTGLILLIFAGGIARQARVIVWHLVKSGAPMGWGVALR